MILYVCLVSGMNYKHGLTRDDIKMDGKARAERRLDGDSRIQEGCPEAQGRIKRSEKKERMIVLMDG